MAAPHSFAVVPTAIGACAIAWSDVGLTGVWLPTGDAGSLQRHVARRTHAAPAVPRGAAAEAGDAIARLLAGDCVDLRGIVLDEDGIEAFDRRVYAVARSILPGEVLTYGEVARRVGTEASARAVGQSLGRNRMPIVVPCHRVVAAGTALGGFSAPGGVTTKQRLLAIENARRPGPPELFDAPAT
jgi:methylated-DNA-[protein]-cysteine S-methyltransferase